MSKKNLIRYNVYLVDYETAGFETGFGIRHKLKTALRLARVFGLGAIIQRVSKTRSGKVKVTNWEMT